LKRRSRLSTPSSFLKRGKMRPIRIILFIAGILSVFFGIVWMIAAAYNPTRAITGFFMLILGGGFVFVAWQVIQEPMPLESYESQIIRLAKRHNGRITVNDVSSEMGMPVKRARRILDQLSRKGSCELQFEEAGEFGRDVYIFPEYQRRR